MRQKSTRQEVQNTILNFLTDNDFQKEITINIQRLNESTQLKFPDLKRILLKFQKMGFISSLQFKGETEAIFHVEPIAMQFALMGGFEEGQ